MHKKEIEAIKTELFELRSSFTTTDVMNCVCEAFDITESEIVSVARPQKLADARRCYVWFARQLYYQTLKSVGHKLNRDHSSIVFMEQSTEAFLRHGDARLIDNIKKVWTKLKTVSSEKV